MALLAPGARWPGAAAAQASPDGFFATPTVYWKSGDHRIDLGPRRASRTEGWARLRRRHRLVHGHAHAGARCSTAGARRFLVVGEFQDVRLHGMDATAPARSRTTATRTTARAQRPRRRPAHALRRAPAARMSFLRVGRQDVKLGSQEVLYPEPNWRYLKTARLGERLVGTVGWSHVERAYDGFAAAVDVAGVAAATASARGRRTGVFEAEDAYRPLHDIFVGGATRPASAARCSRTTSSGCSGSTTTTPAGVARRARRPGLGRHVRRALARRVSVRAGQRRTCCSGARTRAATTTPRPERRVPASSSSATSSRTCSRSRGCASA